MVMITIRMVIKINIKMLEAMTIITIMSQETSRKKYDDNIYEPKMLYPRPTPSATTGA